MLKRGYKLIISVILVFTLFIGCGSAFASADQTNIVVDFASALYYALRAASVTVNSTVAPIQDVLDSITYGAGMPWTPDYTYQGASWDNDILDRSSVYVRPGYVEIDGVLYTDIWLSNDAAQKFRVNAFDLETAWNIVSNSNGTFAEGVGFLNSVPIFNVNGVNTSQAVDYSISGGSSPLAYMTVYERSPSYPTQRGYRLYSTYNDTLVCQHQWISVNSFPISCSYILDSNFLNVSAVQNLSGGGSFTNTVPSEYFGIFNATPFDFDWVSGSVPAETLPSNYGLHIQVPDSYTDPQSGDVIYDFGDLVQEYPDQSNGKQVNFDPDLNPDAQVDVDFTNDLWQILRTILQVLDLLDHVEIEYAPETEPEPEPSPEPTPPPSPEPSTPISDQPAEWLDQILRWIQETINQVKTSTQTLEDILEDILTQVQTLPQQILEDIETAPISIYRTSLEIIKTVFAPVLLLLKATIGLWHYVVEWVQATAPVFSSFFGLMNGTSYNMVLPIYASLAGPIVIAVYKRFGK